MDKYEYKVRSEEISKLIEKEKYAEAVKIADTIDWRRVKSAAMLLKIAALYRISRRNEDSKEMLMLAYERYPTNRSVVYSLCELSIELDDVVAAIEYYKQFAKLAPKDNGVYTLRYRILEAQEASLEERIEILEDLKKKDYQEEWAYELAYLYHRAGLSTKCVEECDDIILWFGDGPYVMKAMELKARHVPLTDAQMQNYDIMRGNAGQNYSSGNYDAENYDDAYNAEGYDGQNYSDDGNYDAQNYDTENYAGQGYDDGNYDAQDYGTENYAGQGYDGGNYDAQNYDTENYAGQGYDGGNYDAQNYDTENYAGQGYDDGSYDNVSGSGEGYASDSYGDGAYGQESDPDGQYADYYAQNNYVDDGYGNLSYVDGGYQDNGYTGTFYVEQIYDENGNPVSPELYDDSDYQQNGYAYSPDEHSQDNGYAEQANMPKEYRNGLHLVENPASSAANPGDMSQYNTINLQKVVAESMKELFPDDNDDVFAEDREKYNSGEAVRDTSGDTRIFGEVSDHPAAAQTTGRVNVARMVTGVSEAVPEPNTGAIKKVLVPGEDARLIKSDSSMEELRDTTERSVDDEHARMEYNDENVYREQSLMDTDEADAASQTPAAPMNLDNVLVEWERMKQDNARKNQENIKNRVLTQTGKIFTDFDNSIKSGILGELEREEEEAERKNQESSVKKGRDGFLDADVTGDIVQPPVSDDDFDVSYMTDSQPEKIQDIPESGQTENNQDSIHAQETVKDQESPYTLEISAEDAENVSSTTRISASYIEEDMEASGDDSEQTLSEDTRETAGTDAGDTGVSDTEEIVTRDMDLYSQEADTEDSDQYAEEAGAGDTEEYPEDPYTEEYHDDPGEYTEELFSGDQEGFPDMSCAEEDEYSQEDTGGEYADEFYGEDLYDGLEDAYSDTSDSPRYAERRQDDQYNESGLDPEDVESIAEMAKEDALKTQEIKMNTADLSSLSEKIVATTKKEASGAKREEIRDFTSEEQTLFENFAVTKKIKKQIIYALENMTLAAYTGNVIITGDAGLDTMRMAKNLIKEYQASDESFSGKLAKITGEKINQRNIKDIFEKLNNGGIIIEKANGMSEEKLYELAINLNQDTLGIVVIMEDTKKEITKLLEKQAMIVDYFNIRIDLMEMDNNALVAYAKNYALALEYSIDELGTLALYTRIANMQSGNHVVTKDEVRDIIDEAIWKSKKSKIKNFVDVLFARRYDDEDMIVLKERDFI